MSGLGESPVKASVIVLVWNGLEYIKPCLDSVLTQDYDHFEVIVVDNGSTDGSASFVVEHFPEVRLIRNPRNMGFSAGNNIGLQAATGDLLVLLNQDTEVLPGWLAALADTSADPTIGIMGSKLLYADGTIQHAGGYVYGPRGESAHTGRHARNDGTFEQLGDVDFVTGAAMAITRPALDQIGYLDEEFTPAYYEDTDWCYRARAAGLRVVYQPRAAAIHHESTTIEEFSYEQKFALNQGRLRFVFKHWAGTRLLTEFGPAESAWVAAMDRCEDLMAARRAYLNTILALRGILAFRGNSRQEADALAGLLSDLRSSAVTSLAAKTKAGDPSGQHLPKTQSVADKQMAELFDALRANQTIREQPFTSQVPVLGRLIVAVRTLWSSVATKWYVRPLIQQQSVFNAQMLNYLQSLEQRSQSLEKRLDGQSLDAAENIRELTALAEQIARIKKPDRLDELVDETEAV